MSKELLENLIDEENLWYVGKGYGCLEGIYGVGLDDLQRSIPTPKTVIKKAL